MAGDPDLRRHILLRVAILQPQLFEIGCKLNAENLLEEIKALLKDHFVAVVRKKGDEIELKFPSGEIFALAVWKCK